jgi:hypothetical protein
VVDPAYATFAGTAAYPAQIVISGQLVTFGWETISPTFLTRDRVQSGDPRLTGVACQANDGNTSVFRIDLPSQGSYSIALAAGDGNGYDEANHLAIADMNTAVLSLNVPTTRNFADATAALWGSAAWPSSSVSVQKLFRTTTFRMTLGGSTDSAYSCVAHLRLTAIPVRLQFSRWPFFIF